MNVVYINSLYFPNVIGGAEYSLRSLVDYVRERGHRAVVISVEKSSKARMEVVDGVRVYFVGLKNIYWPFDDAPNPALLKPFWHAVNAHNPWMARRVRDILVTEQPDLLHTHNLNGFSTAVWTVAHELGVPLVHTVRDYQLLCLGSMHRGGRNCEGQCLTCRPFSWPRQRFSRYVDAVTGCSRFVLERHLEAGFFPNASIRQPIYNAHRGDIQAGSSQRAPDGNGDGLRLGFMGRLRPAKGVGWLLERLQHFRSVRDDWTMQVAGTGSDAYTRHLHDRFDETYVEFLGYVDADAFLRGIDVLIVPSLWHEPFGRVVVEAFAHGVPVVGSYRGGIPEIIESGTSGYLFDPGRPEELFAILNRLLDRPEQLKPAQSAALERARDFTPGAVLEPYLDVYDRVVAARDARASA